MTTHVALLRGVNVGKAKRIAMSDLRATFEGLGFERVRTLLASGNVVFEAKAKDAAKHYRRVLELVPEHPRKRVIEEWIASLEKATPSEGGN